MTSTPGTMGDYDPYYDHDDSSSSLDPNMKSKQFGNPTSPSPFSPHTPSDPGTPRPTPIYSSFRSSVGLIPTPGTVSTRHPTYVRRASPSSISQKSRSSSHLRIGTCPPPILGRSSGLFIAHFHWSCPRGCTWDLKESRRCATRYPRT